MKNHFYLNLLLLSVSQFLLFCSGALADDDDYEFNPDFIKNYAVGKNIDLNKFTQGKGEAPGLYNLRIFINDDNVGQQTIELKDQDGRLGICLTEELVTESHLIDDKINEYQKAQQLNPDACIYLSDLIEESSFKLNIPKLEIFIAIPQVYLRKDIQPENNPQNWESGETVLFSKYFYNRYETKTEGFSNTSNSLNLNSGINFGIWRLRHDSQLNDKEYTSVRTYLERDIDKIKGKLTLGDFYSGSLFSNGSSLRGARIKNDNNMLSSRETGFAPTIQGIAKTQAQVKVYLANSKSEIYSTVVPAGPFAINDLLPIYYSGELLVEIIEANGEIQKILVPVNSNISLTRPGKLDFDVGVGKLRYRDSVFGSTIMDGAVRYGVNNSLSTALGSVVSRNYLSNSAGISLSTNLGLFTSEVIHARAQIDNSNKSLNGNSYKLSYSKDFSLTDTYLNLSSIQYDTKNYVSVYNAMMINYRGQTYQDPELSYKLKTQYTLSLSQKIPYELGNVSLSGSVADYWNSSRKSKQMSASYSTNIKSIGVSTSIQKVDNSFNKDTIFSASISIPFSSENNNTYLTSSVLTTQNTTNINSGVSGGITENLDYNVSLGKNYYENESSLYKSAGLSYRSSIVNLSSDYSQDAGMKSLNLSASGAIVGHSGGVLLSNTLNDSFAIIKAEGVSNANVSGADTKTNRSGYAIYPNLVPYRKNLVGIDTQNLDYNINIEEPRKMVIPRSGSAILVNLDTKVGAPIILLPQGSDNMGLPLGAPVYDNENKQLTFVGQGSKIFLNLNKDLKYIYIYTNRLDDEVCMINLDEITKNYLDSKNIRTLKVPCEYKIWSE